MRAIRAHSSFLAFALAASLAAAGCSKSVPTQQDLPSAAPAGVDANAGSWRMIVLGPPAQLPVPPPSATSSDAYQAELASIKSAQAGLTDAQRQNIQYWAAGGVLRWNEI